MDIRILEYLFKFVDGSWHLNLKYIQFKKVGILKKR